MTSPLVSIVIPSFNRAELLPRALDSVVAQTVNEWEIVLIDDGSTDATPQIADRYATKLGDRFVYRRGSNRGCCAARNLGIELSRGKLVAFLDSDDAFAPTKLQRQRELFERCPGLGLVFSDYACVDLHGDRINSAFDRFYPAVRTLATTEVAPRLHECASPIFDALLRGYFIATIVGTVRRDVLADDIRFAPHLPYAHEWLFYLRVAKRCKAGFVDEPLSIHHFTPDSITRTDAQSNVENLYALLCEMPSALAPLHRRQRRVIARHIQEASRTLGSFAYRRGDFAEAMRWFGRGFRHTPTPRGLYDLLDASCRRVRQVGRRSMSPGRA